MTLYYSHISSLHFLEYTAISALLVIIRELTNDHFLVGNLLHGHIHDLVENLLTYTLMGEHTPILTSWVYITISGEHTPLYMHNSNLLVGNGIYG